MHLGTVTVEIDYRFDAGKCRSCVNGFHGPYARCPRCNGTQTEPPSQRVLMARVRIPADGNSFKFGQCLISPRMVTNIDRAKQLARSALNGKCDDIKFIVSDRVIKN